MREGRDSFTTENSSPHAFFDTYIDIFIHRTIRYWTANNGRDTLYDYIVRSNGF